MTQTNKAAVTADATIDVSGHKIGVDTFCYSLCAWNGPVPRGSTKVLGSAIADPTGFVPVFETHHLRCPTPWQQTKRRFVCWLAQNMPVLFGGLQHVLHDIDDEDRIVNATILASATIEVDDESLASKTEAVKIAMLENPITSIQFGSAPPVPLKKVSVVNTVNPRLLNDYRIALVCKLGHLERNAANVLIVNKTLLKLLQDNCVRGELAEGLIAHVPNVYFENRVVLEKAGGARKKCSRWLLKFLGYQCGSATTN